MEDLKSSEVRPEGFLEDPEGYLAKYHPSNLESTDALLDHQCLVLCGEPGMGKSRILDQHRSAISLSCGGEAYVIWRSFHRDLLGGSDLLRQMKESAQWKLWLEMEKDITLVVDGMDEGLVGAPNLVGVLVQELRGKPTNRLRLILTCRDVEWPKSEGEELLQLWSQGSKQGIYRLKQLRWIDARNAAIHWGASQNAADAFMEAVGQRAVEAFAARPITLQMLFREFQLHGELPQSRIVLFQRACQRLCEEDEDRTQRLRPHQPSFSVPELYSTASGIAVRILLGKRSAISIQPVEKRAQTDLGLEEIAGKAADASTCENVKAVLQRALFADGGNKRRVFAHPTYCEFLAAERLANYSASQLQQVLSRRNEDSHTIVPQLAELAAWVALMSSEFLDWLIEQEPEILLRNDVSTLSESAKLGLLVSLLKRVAQERPSMNKDCSAIMKV